jgi:hypothetical protein
MKKLVKVEEVDGDGLVGLMGENVTLFCLNYIYTGRLTGVNDTFVKLENAGIVYETGSFTDKSFKDVQLIPVGEHYIQTAAIESFGKLKK